MMPQILASINNPPEDNIGNKKPRDRAEITLQACKIFGEIGHTSKGCCE
jgi:hypothetical protein